MDISRQLNFLGDFNDSDQEGRYREYSLDSTRRFTLVISCIVLFASITFLINDLNQSGVTVEVLFSRVIIAVVALISIWLTRANATRLTVYLATLSLTVVVMALNTYVAMMRPPDFLLHLGVDAIILIGVYMIVPTVVLQMLFSFTLTFCLISLHFLVKQPQYDLAHVTVPLTLVLANMIGLGMSVLQNRTRHLLFAQIEDLQLARKSVQALSELIPMCASCKKIRNDAGYWEQVETYMTAISGADISHGVCPDCAKNFYDSN